MDKIRRFLCILIPTARCNLKCQYCYLQHRNISQQGECFKFDVETFRRAFSKERMGGVCMVNFTAHGETLLPPQMPDYVRAMLEEGHYVEVITNATVTRAFETFATFPSDLLSRLMFKCSFHWLELKKRGLFEKFFSNVRMARDAGASFSVELMPHDEIIPDIEEILAVTKRELGAPCHVTVGRDASNPEELPLLTKLPREEYRKTWSRFDSSMFDYKFSVFEKKQRGFCYAGDWMMVLNMGTGMISQCYSGYRSINPFDDLSKPIDFKAIGNFCPYPHCFNAHAWLTFGCIPSADAPYYEEMRNRKCLDGSEWLRPEFKAFCHQKFAEYNKEYGCIRKAIVNVEMMLRKAIRERTK